MAATVTDPKAIAASIYSISMEQIMCLLILDLLVCAYSVRTLPRCAHVETEIYIQAAL